MSLILPTQLKVLESGTPNGPIFLWQAESFGKNVQIDLPPNQTVFHVRHLSQGLEGKKECMKVKLSEGSQYHYFEIQRDTGNSSIEIQLTGAHARAEMYGLIDLNQNKKANWQWEVRHLVPHTSSEQYVKSILQDDGSVEFRGKIFIAPKAQKTDAKQLNKNLLLSKRAKSLSRPELEIFADDVKCAHGLTTSQFREDELFYLQCRGIKAETAKNFLAKAFVNDLLQKVPLIYAPYLSEKGA
jgi:Fe-S cluster assembly protein SufD